WISCADDFVSRSGNDDDRADRKRIEGGIGPFLRRGHRDSWGDSGDRNWQNASAEQPAEERAAHGAGGGQGTVGPSLHAGTGGVSGALDARTQILAGGGAD